MKFRSLFYIDIFAFLAVMGLVLLLISLFFFLINRSKKKKGMEKKSGYTIAGSICLALGCLNLVPVIVLLVWSAAGGNIIGFIDRITVASMPERAVLYSVSSDEGEKRKSVDDYASREEWEDDKDFNENERILQYRGEEYLPMSYYPEDEKIELSEPKAYLQYASSKNEDSCHMEAQLVAEITNDTGFDLLCIGVEDIEAAYGLELSGMVYCRREQCEEFQQKCQSGAVYYLESDSEFKEDRVTGDDFGLGSLGITEDFLDSLDDGQGETLGEYMKDEYSLSAFCMDRLFSCECAYIGKYEGRWYCYGKHTYGEVQDARLLPDEGQRFMNAL